MKSHSQKTILQKSEPLGDVTPSRTTSEDFRRAARMRHFEQIEGQAMNCELPNVFELTQLVSGESGDGDTETKISRVMCRWKACSNYLDRQRVYDEDAHWRDMESAKKLPVREPKKYPSTVDELLRLNFKGDTGDMANFYKRWIKEQIVYRSVRLNGITIKDQNDPTHEEVLLVWAQQRAEKLERQQYLSTVESLIVFREQSTSQSRRENVAKRHKLQAWLKQNYPDRLGQHLKQLPKRIQKEFTEKALT